MRRQEWQRLEEECAARRRQEKLEEEEDKHRWVASTHGVGRAGALTCACVARFAPFARAQDDGASPVVGTDLTLLWDGHRRAAGY